MAKIPRSCGFLILCEAPSVKFLLMKHKDRWDLPKGHVDPGETDLEAAFRELEEETGIAQSEVALDSSFQFEMQYPVSGKRYVGGGKGEILKTLIVFLGYIPQQKEIVHTEHPDSRWFDWDPPHSIQNRTIDPLLQQLSEHLNSRKSPSRS